MACWATVPTEIKDKIFQELAAEPLDVGRDTTTFVGQKPKALANYAAVCREWQQVFEPINFRRLIVGPGQIQQLSKLNKKQRGFVRMIWLRVELYAYTDTGFTREWDTHGREYNRQIFKETVQNLFRALGTWSSDHPGLALEISVHSPSDALQGNYGYHVANSRQVMSFMNGAGTAPHGYNAPGHNSEHIRQQVTRDQDLEGPRWIWPNLVGHGSGEWEIPWAPIVKELHIRRHTRRRIAVDALEAIIGALPELRLLDLEPWHTIDGLHQDSVDIGYTNILDGLGQSVKTVTLFESFYPRNHWTPQGPFMARRWQRPIKTPLQQELIEVVVDRSVLLENLSVSFLIDAHEFFLVHKEASETESPIVWPDLKSITLTAGHLEPVCGYQYRNLAYALAYLVVRTGNHGIVSTAVEELSRAGAMEYLHRDLRDYSDKILTYAANAAASMPRLRSMEIWNVAKAAGGQHYTAGVFRYQRTSGIFGRLSIGWTGTFDLPIGEQAIEAWRRVAELHAGTRLVVEESRVAADVRLESEGEAIQWLDLRLQDQVVSPLSLYEMRTERPQHGDMSVEEWMGDGEAGEDRRPWMWFP